MGKDNWENRAANMKCATCMYFIPKLKSIIGRCRRNAPTMKGFPIVYRSDWCGDHRIDENKVERKSSAYIWGLLSN